MYAPTRAIVAALVAALLMAGCGSTAATETHPSSGEEAAATSPTAQPTPAAWARYNLPAPGGEGTGVTYRIAAPKVSGLAKLRLLTEKSEQQMVDAMVDLLSAAYWDLEQIPAQEQANPPYGRYLRAAVLRNHNASVGNDKETHYFGMYAPDPTVLYHFQVRNLRIAAVNDYWPNEPTEEPVGEFKVSWQYRWISLETNKKTKQPEPHRYVWPMRLEVGLADLHGNDQMKLVWWKSAGTKAKHTPIKAG